MLCGTSICCIVIFVKCGISNTKSSIFKSKVNCICIIVPETQLIRRLGCLFQDTFSLLTNNLTFFLFSASAMTEAPFMLHTHYL
jgi:hypothetical protein